LTVLNKIDRLNDPQKAIHIMDSFPHSVAISALTGMGIPELLDTVTQRLFEMHDLITVFLPYQQGELISLFHQAGNVERTEQMHGGVEVQGRIPGRLIARFQPFIINNQNNQDLLGKIEGIDA